ncbi:response regulator [Phormidium sp. LEGE 05292]|uniref:response regulator n=1 Tax=[Phormidium] sp. LEGE 05292 TaxID=767427 RepID=UPI0018821CC3|nr:response regulator [Phormidium sp. LEGE 05292]MBE9223944.1 response regulator [Phormidium sp. LEGE 05292]
MSEPLEDWLILSADSVNLAGLKVLVVDDDPDSRDLVAFLLEEYGIEVIVVASALEALKTLASVQPDILLCDIGMPDMDGYMLMRQIRGLPPEQGGQIPAIALTAYAGESNQQQALKAGFQRHLAKPVEPMDVIAVIVELTKK